MKERHDSSKTKIIATIGPACSDESTLKKLFYAGIDVCRLNFSHGTQTDHKEVINKIKKINSELGCNVTILADLQGPKIRIGEIEGGSIILKEDKQITIVTKEGIKDTIFINYKDFAKDVNPGESILLDDGKIRLKVIDTNKKDTVIAHVINGGILLPRKGVNLPGTRISAPSLTTKDIDDVNFILENEVDWIALSFVRTASDIAALKKIISDNKKDVKVISKIEKPEAVEHLDEIIDVSDAVMVARGDLGVEVSFNKVPLIQKKIVKKCITKSKPVIIATQMLESMMYNFSPTRAEANDVANAVFDGADTLMLSGETSVGKYPVEAIKAMQSIIDYAEGKEFVLKHEFFPDKGSSTFLPDTVCYNACRMADMANADAMVLFSYSGATAFKIASYRPETKLFVFTPNKKLVNQLSIVWGIKAFHYPYQDPVDQSVKDTIDILEKRNFVKKGNVIVNVGSIPLNERKETNWVKITYV